MAGENGTQGTATVPGTPSAPAAGSPAPEFRVPEGHRLVREDEWSAASRNSERVRGYEDFQKRAKDAGFAKPEDFERWKPALESFNKRKLDPSMLSRMFSDEAVNDGAPERRSDFDPVKFKQELTSEFEFKSAEKDHQSAFRGEQSIVDAAVKDLTDDNTSAFEKKRWGLALRSALDDARDVYPEGHPLRDKYVVQPLTKAHAEKVVAAFKKEMAEDKAATEAKSITGKADALRNAAKKPVSAVAGNGTGQGKSDTKDDRRPDGRPSLASVEAKAEAKMAARGWS